MLDQVLETTPMISIDPAEWSWANKPAAHWKSLTCKTDRRTSNHHEHSVKSFTGKCYCRLRASPDKMQVHTIRFQYEIRNLWVWHPFKNPPTPRISPSSSSFLITAFTADPSISLSLPSRQRKWGRNLLGLIRAQPEPQTGLSLQGVPCPGNQTEIYFLQAGLPRELQLHWRVQEDG